MAVVGAASDPGRESLRFGVFAPQGWKAELAGSGGADEQWATCVSFAREAERLRYDSVWLYDHFHTVPLPTSETLFECWVGLTALAAATTDVRLGPMVSCASYRNAALTAKMAATLDVISGGRLEFGLGAGWADGEYRAYGFEFPSSCVRIEQLAETIEVIRLLWAEDVASYAGNFHAITEARCGPKP